jgi:hypothetical protein
MYCNWTLYFGLVDSILRDRHEEFDSYSNTRHSNSVDDHNLEYSTPYVERTPGKAFDYAEHATDEDSGHQLETDSSDPMLLKTPQRAAEQFKK